MSLTTWEEKYYPIRAERCANTAGKSTNELRLLAAQHSLKKWRGLTPENLAKHGIDWHGSGTIADEDGVWFDLYSETCALCEMSKNKAAEEDGNEDVICHYCPLYDARDGVKCYDSMIGEEQGPWYAATEFHHDVKPMIFWLAKTVDRERWRVKRDDKELHTADSVGVSDV